MKTASLRTRPLLLSYLYLALGLSPTSPFFSFYLVSAQSPSFTPTIVRGSWATFIEGKALYVSGGWTPPDDTGLAQTFLIDLSRPWDTSSPVVTSLDHSGAPVDIMIPSALMGDNNTWLVLSRGQAYEYNLQDNKWKYSGAVSNMFPTQNRTLAGDVNPDTGVMYVPSGYNVATTGTGTTISSMMQLDVSKKLASGISAPNGPPSNLARYSAVWSTHLKQLLVFGGESAPTAGSGRIISPTLYTFTPSSNTWNAPQVQGTLPSPRCSHCFVPAMNGTKMVLFGGWGDYSRTIAYSDIYILDLATWTWTKGPDAGPSTTHGRGMSACAASGDLFVSWGGGVGTDAIVTQDTATLVFNFKSLQWVSRYEPPISSTPMLPPPSSGPNEGVGSSVPVAAIAGGVAGGVAVLVCIVGLLLCHRRRRSRHRSGNGDGGAQVIAESGDSFNLISRPESLYSNVKAELSGRDNRPSCSVHSSDMDHTSYSSHQSHITSVPIKDLRGPQFVPAMAQNSSVRSPHSEPSPTEPLYASSIGGTSDLWVASRSPQWHNPLNERPHASMK
ncbi:hypothetical protein BG004_002519 [Podila humilis]|nr:hypothetical protein BG004_002519 [Podila humilis]